MTAQSPFGQFLAERYGSVMGPSIAARAETELRGLGIDPLRLRRAEAKGGNSALFTLGGEAFVKVSEDMGAQYSQAVSSPCIWLPNEAATLGYDAGGLPVTLRIVAPLNTRDVTAEHVKALCRELETQGLLFQDNKPDNVGLTRSGIPYVLDDGAVIPRSALSPLESPYHYRELSGRDQAAAAEGTGTKLHRYTLGHLTGGAPPLGNDRAADTITWQNPAETDEYRNVERMLENYRRKVKPAHEARVR